MSRRQVDGRYVKRLAIIRGRARNRGVALTFGDLDIRENPRLREREAAIEAH